MENKFTTEQLEKAKKCKSVENLLTLAKEDGIELTESEAKNYFAQLNPENGELADSELELIAVGKCFAADIK